MNFLEQFNLGDNVELGEKKERNLNTKPLEEYTIDDWKERLKISVRKQARGAGKEPTQWRATIQISTGILPLDPSGKVPHLFFPIDDFSKENVADKMSEILQKVKDGDQHNDFILELGQKVINTTKKALEGRKKNKDKSAKIEDLATRIEHTDKPELQMIVHEEPKEEQMIIPEVAKQEPKEEQLIITEASPAKAKEVKKTEKTLTPAQKRKATIAAKKEAEKSEK